MKIHKFIQMISLGILSLLIYTYKEHWYTQTIGINTPTLYYVLFIPLLTLMFALGISSMIKQYRDDRSARVGFTLAFSFTSLTSTLLVTLFFNRIMFTFGSSLCDFVIYSTILLSILSITLNIYDTWKSRTIKQPTK